jgi:transcriptional regulator with XRE-family HTH domain
MPKKKDRPKHILRWTREQLGLSQARLAELIGASIFSVQSIETGRMPLSERYAYRLSAATGIEPAWFVANKLNPQPDVTTMQAHFDEAQQGTWKGAYLAHLLPRMFINQFALLAQAVANKHGEYAACRRAGFFDALASAGMKILATIDDPEERAEVYEAVRAEIQKGDAKALGLLAARNREIQRALREMAAAGATPQPGGGELFAAWAAATGIPLPKGPRSAAGGGRGRSSAAP